MTEGRFNRVSTRMLAFGFCGVLLLLLAATAASILNMRSEARLAEDRAAVRAASAFRAESARALSSARGDALRAVMAASTAPTRAFAERSLAAVTRQWHAAIAALRQPEAGVDDVLLVEELSAIAGRVAEAQADVLQSLARDDIAGAQRTYIEREVAAERALQDAVDRLVEGHRSAAVAIMADSATQARRLFLLLAAVVALVIAGGGLGGHALIRRATSQASDLHRERALSEVTLQSINDGVLTVDRAGRVDFMNPVAEALTGCCLADARGRPLSEVYPLVDERTRESHLFQPWLASTPPQRRHEGEAALRLRARDGRDVSIRHSFSRMMDLDGADCGAIIVFHDDTTLRSLAQQLSWQASHDALTGLANRREFERTLTEMLGSAARGHRTHALLYIDLDHFKAVNDIGGHAAGDELLRQVTALMQSKMRASDMLARLGGDEFGALLDSCPVEQATRIAHVLREAVNDFVFVWQGRQFQLGVTIGLLPLDAGSGSVARAIASADALCYQGKAQGRDRVQVYRADEASGRRRSFDARMVAQIGEAFENDRFVLYVQPVAPLCAELADRGLREVLVRMLDGNDHLLLPSSFLPAAERYELLQSIDRWVLRKLVEHLAARRGGEQGGAGHALRHSVNVSSASLQDPEFRAFVRGLIEGNRLLPGQLCLELTEVGAMANLTRIAEAMQELRAVGCSFALDDFGVGLSAFSCLRYLPIDYLKIEAGFVRDMVDDPMDSAIVDSIVRIGQLLGIHTVAQGVDDLAIAGRLVEMGVDYAQGSQYGAPRPLDDGRPCPEPAHAMPASSHPSRSLSQGAGADA